MVWLEFSSSSTQLTVALSAGLGIGVLVGLLLARRRRKLPVGLVQTDSATTETSASELNYEDVSGEYKMVFVVRNDLKMGKGKVAAQCGHAAIGAYKQLLRKNPQMLENWECMGSMKVVLKALDEDSFMQVSSNAVSLGINTHIVRDAGRTQIAPGSKTVVCVGPGPASIIDQVTGHLKLY